MMNLKSTKPIMSPVETEQKRDELLNNTILPYVVKVFIDDPRLQSAALCLAYYDQVLHYVFVWSQNKSPELASGLRSVMGNIKVEDKVNLFNKEGKDRAYQGFQCGVEDDCVDMPGDEVLIPLFACFTKEAPIEWCSDHALEQVPERVYSPYALFRRVSEDQTQMGVGKMIRPMLDGLPRDAWELRVEEKAGGEAN